MLARIGRSALPKDFRPMIGDEGEVWISVASEIGDQFWERVREVLVIPDAEAIPLHNDVAAKTACIMEKRGDSAAFRRRKNRSCNCISALRKSLLSAAPVQRIDPFGDGNWSGSISCCLSHAASQYSQSSIKNKSIEHFARENLSDLRRQISRPSAVQNAEPCPGRGLLRLVLKSSADSVL